MYEIYIANSKTEKLLLNYISMREVIREKLDKLKENPKRANGAHPLHGKLKGKWACWLGANIRMIYIIDEIDKKIFIEAVGSHKIY